MLIPGDFVLVINKKNYNEMTKKKGKWSLLYHLGPDFGTKGLHCIKWDWKDFNEYRFYDGEWIDDWPDDIEFVVDGEPLDDLILGGLHWLLYSEGMRQIFEQEKVPGVQFLPVKVLYAKTGNYIGPYWAPNIMLNASSIKVGFDSGYEFFRQSTATFISDRLKRLLEKAKVTRGIYFNPIPMKLLGLDDSKV